MEIAIVIASTGRPTELARWTDHIKKQTRAPKRVIFSIASENDIPAGFSDPAIDIFYGPKGSSAQRNHSLDLLPPEIDIVAFYDDDFVPSRYSVEGIAKLFSTQDDVVAATGLVLQDGILTPGIEFEEASSIVDAFDAAPPAEIEIETAGGTYGCNMVFRRSAIGDRRFDERLPLYGWLEDLDFSSGFAREGRVVKTNAFAGVHQGTKRGRTSGLRLGYSQVANPLYLLRKGSISSRAAYTLMARTVLKNHARALFPEPWVDRPGRMKGNWLAFRDLLTSKLAPERILDL